MITLDGAQTLFISSDELVFSLKGEKCEFIKLNVMLKLIFM